MSAIRSSEAANLPAVETKLTPPDSLPTPTPIVVPSSCIALESASPSRVFVPSLIIDAVRLARPRLSAGSNCAEPPRKLSENDTSGRSCFSETMSSAPLASVVFVHAGTRRTGGLPAGGTALRSSG